MYKNQMLQYAYIKKISMFCDNGVWIVPFTLWDRPNY